MSNQAEVQETSDLRVYEVGYHLVPKVAEGEVPAVVESLKKVLSAHGVSVIAEEDPRMIQLAYSMSRASTGRRDRYNQAWFGWIKFEVDPTQVKSIEEEVNRIEQVLRSIIISTVRESTRSLKVFVSERPMGDTIRKPERAMEGEKKLSDAEIETAVDELVADASPEEVLAPEEVGEIKAEA